MEKKYLFHNQGNTLASVVFYFILHKLFLGAKLKALGRTLARHSLDLDWTLAGRSLDTHGRSLDFFMFAPSLCENSIFEGLSASTWLLRGLKVARRWHLHGFLVACR